MWYCYDCEHQFNEFEVKTSKHLLKDTLTETELNYEDLICPFCEGTNIAPLTYDNRDE